jgi:hypothetical protein
MGWTWDDQDKENFDHDEFRDLLFSDDPRERKVAEKRQQRRWSIAGYIFLMLLMILHWYYG